MADQSNGLAGIVERFEKSDRHWVLRQIPHRTVSARIKHRIKVSCLHIRKLHCVCEGLQRPLILLEPYLRRSLIFRQVALWIDRRLPTFRRGQREIDTGISENKVRGRTLFKPKTGFTA